MSVIKVLELMADSNKSWEDAAQKAVTKASKSVDNIRSVWVQDFAATVNSKGKLTNYRVTCKVSFQVGK